MGLINWNSDPKKIAETVAEEVPYALRWLTKKTSNRECRQQLMRLREMAITTGEAQCLPTVVEYTSNAGNKWLMVLAIDNRGFLIDCLMMYGLTERYMWSAMMMNCSADSFSASDGTEVALFTPHFFQRLYERVGIEQENRQIALRNFLMIARVMPVRVENSKRIRGGKDVFGRLKGCVCYGHVKDKVFYFNTVLPETHMSIGNIIRTRGFRKMSDSEYTTITEFMADAYNQVKPVAWVRRRCKEYMFDKEATEIMTYSIGVRLACLRMLGEYRMRLGFSDSYELRDCNDVMADMIHEFCQNSIVPTYETLYPWLIRLVRAAHKDFNGAALWKSLNVMKELCGEGTVDWDNFHMLSNDQLDKIRRGLLI